MDFTTSEVTAIAASFGPDEPVYCWLLDLNPGALRASAIAMLTSFRAMWDQADIVTGHYILKHDIPIINGAMAEYGLPTLSPKDVSDTKIHLVKASGVSKSQESLAAMLGVHAPKVGMSQRDWRDANRGFAPEKVTERVVGDVRQHQELRRSLISQGMLRAPKLWRP
jgi:hypothetical protein